MATVELGVLLIELLDYAASINPLTYITVYIDDLSLEASGLEGMITGALLPVLKYIASCLHSIRIALSQTNNFCSV